MHDEHPYDVFCQSCNIFFRPDAEDMDRWRAGFAPVRCPKCKEQKRGKKDG